MYLTSRGVGTTYINRSQRALETVICVFFTMDPLRAVEDIVGDVDSWPTYIICDLFVTNPNTISVKHVIAFMYSKGVPIEKAVDCFIAYVGMDSYYFSCAMKDWYSIWDNAAHNSSIIPRLRNVGCRSTETSCRRRLQSHSLVLRLRDFDKL